MNLVFKLLNIFGAKLFVKAWTGFNEYKQYEKNGAEIVFYAETKNDYSFFDEIITGLINKHQKKVCYITSDLNDPLLIKHEEGLNVFFIGNGIFLTILFKSINAKLFVMTLPDLNSYHLKRSINPVHYVYIFHNMLSTHMVFREHAYDSYDSILCVGPHHFNELRKTEEVYNLKPRKLYEHGYARLDKILKTKNNDKPTTINENSVIIAPSWGEHSLTNLCLEKVVDSLMASKIRTTLRPHPMTMKQQPELVKNILNKYKDNPLLSFDNDISSVETFNKSQIMISDWSGAALEFSFGHEKPVIFIDVPKKINNPNYENLGITPFEVSIRHEIGEVVSLDEISRIGELAIKLLENSATNKKKIQEIRTKSIFNIGTSNESATTHIVNILKDQIT